MPIIGYFRFGAIRITRDTFWHYTDPPTPMTFRET
jgi:hypothetical protein